MTKALYYPHTQIGNAGLLKNGLLLWDQVQTIYPARQSVDLEDAPRLIKQAQEILLRPRVPTDEEKRNAQRSLSTLLSTGALHRICKEPAIAAQRGRDRYRPSTYDDERFYRIFSGKFLEGTWSMLEHEGLAALERGDRHASVPANLGFLMMSLLADACAGTQIEKITDRVEAYSWLNDLRAQELDSQVIRGFGPDQVATAYDRLISVSFTALGAEHVPIRRLIDLRKREAKSASSDLAILRQKYHKVLREYLVKIGEEAKTANDFRELEEEFKQRIKEDVSSLRSELGLATAKALWSKEFVVSAIALAGALAEPISSLTALGSGIGALGVIPLMAAKAGYRAARKQALEKHFSSWVYVAKPTKLAAAVRRLHESVGHRRSVS